jgi:L-asparagine transporter-like permease
MADREALLDREAGLYRKLTPWQMAMIGLGSSIGTGLFLGSGHAVKLAGPAAILSFLVAALVALSMTLALAEMAAAHPAAGSFGLYAEMYLNPWAGYAIRLTYWLSLMAAVGSEVVAVQIYFGYWFRGVPAWLWIALISVLITYLNTIHVQDFGLFEILCSITKVLTVALFLVLGASLLFGVGFPAIGLGNYTSHGGFFPHGWTGVALGVVMGMFSFFGIEVVGSTAGEAADPQVEVPRALRRTLLILAAAYIAGLAVVVGVVPWTEIGLGKSPFVRVFESVGVPGAGDFMNFVVLTAALSSAIANLYFAARLAFSLSRGGYLPSGLGRLSRKGMPVTAVATTAVGMLTALWLSSRYQESLFLYMIGLSTFGALFAWLMTLLTHLAFRRTHARSGKPYLRIGPAGPWVSCAGFLAVLAVLVSTWWVPGFGVTLRAGLPWLAFATLCYFVWGRARLGRPAGEETKNG